MCKICKSLERADFPFACVCKSCLREAYIEAKTIQKSIRDFAEKYGYSQGMVYELGDDSGFGIDKLPIFADDDGNVTYRDG